MLEAADELESIVSVFPLRARAQKMAFADPAVFDSLDRHLTKAVMRWTLKERGAVVRHGSIQGIPADPGAETGRVNSLLVWNAYCRSSLISSMSCTNSGSRCPMVGLDRAPRTRGETSEGPGPINVRRGGKKLLVMCAFPVIKKGGNVNRFCARA